MIFQGRTVKLRGCKVYMAVTENNGTPKSSILIGFSIINHPGIPLFFGNTHIEVLLYWVFLPQILWPPTVNAALAAAPRPRLSTVTELERDPTASPSGIVPEELLEPWRQVGVPLVDPSLIPDVGYWLLVVGFWLLVVGCWLLVVGCWLLVVCCWLLVVGCWLLVVGCWLLVVGCLLLVVGCWLLVVGCWLFVVGCWLLVVGCWLLVVGCWLLVVGCWLLVVGCWLLLLLLLLLFFFLFFFLFLLLLICFGWTTWPLIQCITFAREVAGGSAGFRPIAKKNNALHLVFSTHMYPYHPCMVYLPTFGEFIW